MRYILLSDVHANKPALEAVLRDAAMKTGVTGTYHQEGRALLKSRPQPSGVAEVRVGGVTHAPSTRAPWEAWLTAA